MLHALKGSNARVANLAFDLVVQPLEEKVLQQGGELTAPSDTLWRALLHRDLLPALCLEHLSRASRCRRGRFWMLCARVGARRAAGEESCYDSLVESTQGPLLCMALPPHAALPAAACARSAASQVEPRSSSARTRRGGSAAAGPRAERESEAARDIARDLPRTLPGVAAVAGAEGQARPPHKTRGAHTPWDQEN